MVPLTEGSRLLKKIARQVCRCPRCPELVRHRTHAVAGTGEAGSTVMLVGEAPGREEDRRGEPFVGPAGQTLNKLLDAVGLAREATFITSVIKCRPPGNRNPSSDEIEHCRPYLERQIQAVGPRAIAALGLTAAQWLTGSRQPMAALREEVHVYEEIPVVCTYHPAYVRRNPTSESKVLADLRRLLDHVAGA